MENRGRAYTRQQRDKSKARRKRQFGDWNLTDGQVNKMSTYRGMCSCSMCGNPRRHFGELTIQERRAA